MNIYAILLQTHSLNRWLVAGLLLFVTLKSLAGWLGGGRYGKLDNALGGSLVGFTHLQLLVGLILYFISPNVKAALSNMGAAMKDANLRFVAVEHLTMMLLAVLFIQMGRTMSKRVSGDTAKFKRLAITGILAIVLLALGVKWAM